jgi:hypothetical protein
VNRRRFVLTAASTLALSLVVATAWVAEAQALRAQVFVTQAQIPRGLTAQGLVRFARGHRARRMAEDRTNPIPHRQWKGALVVAFNRAIGDIQFDALFYDVENAPRFIGPALTVFLGNRTDTTILHRFHLDRPDYKPDMKIEVVITVRHQEVGRARFQLDGEQIRHSGEVTFD